jgi:hypothetical protein
MSIWELHEAVIIGWEMDMQKTVDIFLGYAIEDKGQAKLYVNSPKKTFD